MLKFDLYRKLPQDLIEPSLSGGFISVFSIVLMSILFMSELNRFFTQQIWSEMYVDQTKEGDLRVNLDIEFPNMPCDLLSVDQQDIIGTHSINLQGNLIKKRIKNGQIIETYASNNEPEIERAKQAFIDNEGCQLVGYIFIQKVPGNFHISAHPYGGILHLIEPFVGIQTIDLSHKINHLSFGDQSDIQNIMKIFNQGALNPLDGIKRIKIQDVKNQGVTHQYYLSIVPTIYIDINGYKYYTHQITANTNEALTSQMPVVFFRYEISPVTVQYTKYYETFWHFIVQLCAILGGVFSIASIIDQLIYGCNYNQYYKIQIKIKEYNQNNDNYNKYIYYIYMSEKAKIRVAVRVRPLLETEIQNGYLNSRLECTNNDIQVKEERTRKSFKFDHILNEDSTQQEVYKECEVDFLVQKVTEGYHATIFAYGQTGSGKTYTMDGLEDDGIIPKTLNSLFSKINKTSQKIQQQNYNTNRMYKVYCSYMQIYNEKIYDLLGGFQKLNPSGPGLKLRWNLNEQFTVENLLVFECKSQEEVMQFFRQGVKNRVTASHKLNLTSSRSHSILELKLESIDLKNPESLITSKLELVDLAGSERISQTGAEGKQAKESIEINKSLLTLRQVIANLADINSKQLPPYRDSKLTSLLKQSIGGNSYCLMIACLAPADQFYEENISTLQYATKAAYITNIPIRNDDPKYQIIRTLKSQMAELRSELNKANEHIEFLTTMVQQKEGVASVTQNKIDNGEKLADSIKMVKELLQSNKEMREKEEQVQQRCEFMQREIIDLQRENFELREQLVDQSRQPSPSKVRPIIKRNTLIDDTGFLPEQTTQFQKSRNNYDINNRNIRAYSLKNQGPQLPLLKQGDDREEMTNFGRRTIYQKQMKQQ